MPLSRNIFVGGLDSDTAPEGLAANKYTSARNIVLGRGAVEPAWGNILLDPTAWLPNDFGVYTRTVGAVTDAATGHLYTLTWRSTGEHCVGRLNPRTNAYELLIRWAGLKIPAFATKNVGFLDGFLLYLDSEGEVRNVPVERAATGYYTPERLAAEPYSLHLTKQAPAATPAVERLTVAGTVGVQVAGSAYQFATRYRFHDGEVSPFSPLSSINFPRYVFANGTATPDTANTLRVTLPAAWPALADELEVVVRQDNQTTWLVAARLTAAQPYFDFVGVTTGEAVDEQDSIRSYEVLWPANVLGVAQDRAWVADLHYGYPTPQPALAVSLNATPENARTETVYRVNTDFIGTEVDPQYGGTTTYPYTRTELYVAEAGQYPDADSTYRRTSEVSGGYEVETSGPVLTYTQAFLDRNSGDEFQGRGVDMLPNQVVLRGTGQQITVQATLPQRSNYRVGIQFYDALGRPGGVGSAQNVTIPANPDKLVRRLTWSLDASRAAAEIPAWATSYQLCLSANQSKTLFRQFRVVNSDMLIYLGDNPTTGEPRFSALGSNVGGGEALWIAVDRLHSEGLAYTFSPGSGDRLRFLAEENEEYPILYQRAFGNKVYVAVGRRVPASFKPAGADIEIYTPNMVNAGTGAPFYERGPRYAITRSTANGATTASYSVTSGSLEGDAFRRPLAGTSSVYVEAMQPTPQTASYWLDASRGRPALAFAQSRQVARRTATVQFSGARLSGTYTNGLSQWRAEDAVDCPQEQGAIVGLTIASQTQSDGSIFLVNQRAGATSLYLGKVPVSLATGGQLSVLAERVVGGQNPLQGGYGCQHPASITAHGGRVYWWDAINSEVIRYAGNGATPLAEKYQAVRRCRELTQRYPDAAVFGGYDPGTESYVLFFGATNTQQGEALVFSEREQAFADKWDLRHSEFTAEVNDRMLSFYGGRPWLHTPEAPRLRFFDEPMTASITTCVNEASEYSKTWVDVSLSAPEKWRLAFRNDLGQQSYLLPNWLKQEKGIWRTALRRDENTPGLKGTTALLQGRELQSPTLDVTLTYEGEQPARLVSMDLGYYVNPGQNPPQ